jgi:uncharacterized protein (DUF433 family)
MPQGKSHAIVSMSKVCEHTTRASMTTHERVEMNPEVMGGKPVIRGTRVPVEIVLRKLGAGMTPDRS